MKWFVQKEKARAAFKICRKAAQYIATVDQRTDMKRRQTIAQDRKGQPQQQSLEKGCTSW